MKVNEASAIEAAQAIKPPEPRPPPAQTDRVSLTPADEVAQIVQHVRNAAATARVRHSQELEAAVQGGTYRPSSERLAQSILQAAILDAQLSAMMKR